MGEKSYHGVLENPEGQFITALSEQGWSEKGALDSLSQAQASPLSMVTGAWSLKDGGTGVQTS